MVKVNKTAKLQAKEDARLNQQKALEEHGVKLNGKIHFPEFWKKRKHMINASLMKELQDTADKEPEVTDSYGEYKTGTFLHRNCIVTVTRENDLWAVHIFSAEHMITQPVIQEVRDKFVPDYCMMIQFYPSRQERTSLQGIQLCELPGSVQEDKDPLPETPKEELS